MGQLRFTTNTDVKVSFWKGVAIGVLLGAIAMLGGILTIGMLLGIE